VRIRALDSARSVAFFSTLLDYPGQDVGQA
jgi:hypothetical protein